MKMSCLFLMTALLQLSATAYSQATKFDMQMENATIKEIFKAIEAQSEFRFFYSDDLSFINQRKTVDVNNVTVESILDRILAQSDLTYRIFENNLIVVTPEGTLQQGITITGTVTDTNGEPLPGVTVMIKGITQGTATDANGAFSLQVQNENAILVFSYIGFISQEMTVGNRRTINVTLLDSSRELEEVVVVGYGTQKKINLTGAVDVISGERLTNRQSPNVSQMLQGAAAGFDFTIGDTGGFQPGATMNMTIRGMGSLNGGTPYILIDGFPGDINNLNPEDVESITVLKDAAASAIYGARASFGVVLVTTKRGKKTEKMNVTYSGNIIINTPQKLPTQLDSYTWARYLNEAARNMGGPPFSDATIDRIIAFQNEDWDYLRQSMPGYPAGAAITGAYMMGNNWDDENGNQNFANNDWWDIFWGHSVNQKHNLSIQGGTNKAAYFFSAGYLEQNGVMNFIEDIYSRMNIMGKMDVAIADWWDFGWETRFAKMYRKRPSVWGNDYQDMFGNIARIYPNTPLYDGWGNFSNATYIPDYIASSSIRDDFDTWNNFKMEFRPVKGWKINADFGYNLFAHQSSGGRRYVMRNYVDQTVSIMGNSIPNYVVRGYNLDRYWTTNIYSSYTFDINNRHNFSLMAGLQFEKGRYAGLQGTKTDVLVESVVSLQTAVGNPEVREWLSHSATQGYFTRFTYNYQERYLLETNMRYDGSYVFREGNRWGFFPSFSVGWNVHREDFWEGISDYVNTFRLKGSWGQLGNQNVSPYSDLELIPLQSGKLGWVFNYGQPQQMGYTSAPGIVNMNLTWETITTTNIGVDMSFLNNKLQAVFDWFERNTTDMVGPSEARPGVLGASVPSANNSTLRTRGWELSLNWKQALNNGFAYFVNTNLYNYKSVVTKYNNPTGTLSTWYEGKEVGELWGYTVHDLFRSQPELDAYLATTDLSFLSPTWRTGDVKYEDTNGDGKVNNGSNTVNDHGDLSIIGNSEPRYMFGFNIGASYKGIDFSMLWRGVAKKDIYFSYSNFANLYWGFHHNWWQAKISSQHLDYFRDEPGTKYVGIHEGDANINTTAWWPRPYLNSVEQSKNFGNSNTRFLMNAAYLRLQNIQIGYALPQIWTSKFYIDKLRIYFAGENLFTFSYFPNGIDPVAPESGGLTYGADRIYSFGINITY